MEIIAAYSQLAPNLGVAPDLSPDQLVTQIKHALARRTRWLLVFDNAEEPTLLAPFLPDAGQGAVLITSRNPAWHGIATPVEVTAFTLAEASEFLQQRTGHRDPAVAKDLAEQLGRLPLALEQAAAYIDGHQPLTLTGYRSLLVRYRAQLLAQGTPLGAHPTVAATFTLAFDQLRESLPAAAQLLELCTFLAADSLPVALLMVEPALLPDPLGTAAEHPLGRQQILGALYQRGLLQNDADGTARIHRLVQAIARDQLADQQATLAAAVALLAGLFPHEPWPANWNRCAQLLAHALAALTHANEHQLTTPATIDLLVCTGHYVTARGLEPDLAHELHCRALEMCKQLYGDQTDHPDTARCLNNLGSTLRALGQLKDAQDHHEQALAMRYRLYPGDHPLIARTLNSLATTIRAQGNLKRARQLDKDTLAMLRRLHDRDHPELARGLNSLASTLRALDQPKAARPLDEEALAMRRRLYGNDHPHIADSLHNLASDQRALNQPTAARALDKDALAMRRRLYHGDHPKIADSLDSLAQDQRRLGHWYAAHRLNKQAGTIRSRLSQRSEAPRRVELGVLDRLR